MKQCGIYGALIVALGLAGCSIKPEDIDRWKAEGNTRKLISVLDDPRQFMRVDAIDALAELHAVDAIDPLARLTYNSDLFLANKAIEALAGMDDPRIEPHMIRLLDYQTIEARTLAAVVLGERKCRAAVEPMLAKFNDVDDGVVAAVAKSLGQIGDPRAVKALADNVDSRSYDVRLACVRSLSQLGGDDAVPALTSAMGDISPDVRNTAVEGLIGIGAAAETPALEALRSNNPLARASGTAILQGIDRIPAMGSDRVWYELALLTGEENPRIMPEKAAPIAAIEDNMAALLEAAAHRNEDLRDYACLALEFIGEPAVPEVTAAAEALNSPYLGNWYEHHTDWPGAPAWQLDLWSASALLNPRFAINPRIVSALIPHSHSAEQIMKSEELLTRRQYIPMLIAQFASKESVSSSYVTEHTFFGIDFSVEELQFSEDKTEGQVAGQRARRCRELAMALLIDAGYQAYLPLIAALDDDDLYVAAWAAKTLLASDPARAIEPVVAAFEQHVDRNDELTDTPLYESLQRIEIPEIQAVLTQVRPNEIQAVRMVEEQFPEYKFTPVPLEVQVDPRLRAAPFKLAYTTASGKQVLKVVFRPDESGNWVPNPPLPDTLPE